MKLTLNKINERAPCRSGWVKLLKHLGKTKADDEELDLSTVLKSNGIQDAVWCLCCFDYEDYCLFLADVAESVLHIYERNNTNTAPRDAITAIREYKQGKITKHMLLKAADAADAAAYATDADADAYAAAYDAAYATYAAAYAAAYAADAAADAAAYAAADVAAYAAADAVAAAADVAAYVAAADARKKKWQEIEKLFIKHFVGKD